jgi:hypothetical protein
VASATPASLPQIVRQLRRDERGQGDRRSLMKRRYERTTGQGTG